MTKDNKYFSTIDILRGVACMMVVFFHFSTHNSYNGDYLSETNLLRVVGSYGYLGVYAFFVISGFIIPYSLAQNNYKIKNSFIFLKKRMWRLWPAYFVSLLLVMLHTKLHSSMWGIEFRIEWLKFFLHLIYLPSIFGYEWYNILYWTLGIEFQFYILMALAYPFFVHKHKIVRVVTLLLFALIYLFFQDGRYVTSQSALFVFGILAFMLYTSRLSLLEFLILMSLNVIFVQFQHANGPILIAIVGVVTSLVIVYVNLDFWIGKELGKISYSLYLTHGFIAVNALLFSLKIEYVKEYEWLRILVLVVSMIFSIALAYLYWFLIERPSQLKSKEIEYEAPLG